MWKQKARPLKPLAIRKLWIEGERCLLRPIRKEDARRAYYLVNDPEVTKNLYWDGPKSYKDLYATYKAWEWARLRARNHHLAIIEKRSQMLAGSIGLRFETGPYQPTIGYWLGIPYWNRGLGSEAVRLTTYLAFEHLRCIDVRATTFPWNLPSQKILEKSAYHNVGELPRDIYKNGQNFREIGFLINDTTYWRQRHFYQPLAERIRVKDV